jgi:hypothetical protein
MCDCCQMFSCGEPSTPRCDRHGACGDCPDHGECPEADVAFQRILSQIREQDARIPDVCAWCEVVIRGGLGPISHGICPSCYDRLMKEIG